VLAKDESYEGEKGFVTAEKLEKYINLNGYDLQKLQYFICGPAVMQTSILKSLKLMGVNKKNIHYERFSL
jgi:predicted ferric reductase